MPAVDPPAEPGHLIHIGFAKAASTSLQAWFKTHPEIAYEYEGIAGFIGSTAIARQSAQGDAPRLRVTSAEVLSSPSRHSGSFGYRGGDEEWPVDPNDREAVCRTLASLFPTARILLVTRGFQSVYRSGYSQYVRMGGRHYFDPSGQQASAEVLRAQWDYSHVVRIYREAFGDRVLVLPFELLRDDEDRFFSILQTEFELTTQGPRPPRANPGLNDSEMHWYPRLTRLVEALPVRGRLRRRLLDAWVHRTYENRYARLVRVLQRVRPAPPLPRALRPELIRMLEGCSDALRDEPLFAPYADDYLF